MRSNDGFVGRFNYKSTPIGVSDGKEMPEHHWQNKTKFDTGRKHFFPPASMEYQIMARLDKRKYENYSNAKERCKELHGTIWDGVFLSANYFTFYKKTGDNL